MENPFVPQGLHLLSKNLKLLIASVDQRKSISEQTFIEFKEFH
jgi:hypothetical protein